MLSFNCLVGCFVTAIVLLSSSVYDVNEEKNNLAVKFWLPIITDPVSLNPPNYLSSFLKEVQGMIRVLRRELVACGSWLLSLSSACDERFCFKGSSEPSLSKEMISLQHFTVRSSMAELFWLAFLSCPLIHTLVLITQY